MFLVWSALLVALDQATKLWAQGRFVLHGEELPLGLGFALTYTRNTGAAFGMLRDLSLPIGPVVLDGTLVLGLLSAAVSVLLIVYLWRNADDMDRVTYASLTFVLAGAAGNMIDRLRLGYVIDFIHFQVGSFDFPVFNIADSCVVVGATLLLVHSFRSDQSRREPALSVQPEDERLWHERSQPEQLERRESQHEDAQHERPNDARPDCERRDRERPDRERPDRERLDRERVHADQTRTT